MRKFEAAENIADEKEECGEEDDKGTVWYFLDKIKYTALTNIQGMYFDSKQ